jgi:YVTN family beta-propeller protein
MRLHPASNLRLLAIVSALAVVPIAAVPATSALSAGGRSGERPLTSSVTVGAQPEALAYDSANGDIYVVDSYYASYSGGDVSVIDPATGVVVTTVTLGDHPVAIAYDPANKDLYVADAGAAEVSVINGATNALATTIKVGNLPQAVVYDAINADIYVANSSDGTVSVIDGATNAVDATVTVGTDPLALTVDPDDGDVFVADWSSNDVSIISGATETVTVTTAVGPQPITSTFDSINGDIYVVNADPTGNGSVSVLNGSTGAIVTTVGAGVFPDTEAFDPENGDIYVGNLGGTAVSVIDGATQYAIPSVNVGDYPDALLYDPDNGDVYVADYGANQVAAINAEADTKSGTLTVGEAPAAFAFDTATGTIFVANYDDHSVTSLSGTAAPDWRQPDRGDSRLAVNGARAHLSASPAANAPSVARATDSTTTNWGSFLSTPQHSGYAATATSITTANAASLTKAWNFTPPAGPIPGLPGGFLSSPTVVNGDIYIGANNGIFYAISENTGALLWQDPVGYVDRTTCSAYGFTSTATVEPDPVTDAETVYVAGPNGYLYALDAANGKVVWQSAMGIPFALRDDFYTWSSPTVSGGTVYIGVTSECDQPLVRGSVLAFNQHTGALTGTYYVIPAGALGGSVWSSIAIAPSGTVFVASGNGPDTDQTLGQSESVIALQPQTLAYISSWQAPATLNGDLDFGASPTVWSAVLGGQKTYMVGVMNKAGIFFAFNQDNLAAGPAWTLDVAPPGSTSSEGATSAAAWNGKNVFIASPTTLIKGVSYAGSVREVNSGTGAVLWATGLSGTVKCSPTLDAAGVLSVATFEGKTGATNGDYLINAANGSILTEINEGPALDFATPVFSGPYLLLATQSGGLTAYQAP